MIFNFFSYKDSNIPSFIFYSHNLNVHFFFLANLANGLSNLLKFPKNELLLFLFSLSFFIVFAINFHSVF